MKTKNSIYTFLLISFLLISFTSYSQSVTEEWVQKYNETGYGWDYANSIAVDESGNVYVTGKSRGIGTNEDYATIKYNPSGVQQWVARYNGPGNGNDAARSITVDGLGNVYVTGFSLGNGTGNDFATIKYNSAGVEQWVSRYNGPGNGGDGASSITVDGLGNVYVTGHSLGSGTGFDFATIKYNSFGVEQWVSRYNGPGNNEDAAISLAVDGSGNVYVAGHSYGSGTGRDFATIKYNSNGVQQWVSRYNGPLNGEDVVYSLAVDGSGNVYVLGSSEGNGTNYDYTIIKYNSSGVQQWVSRYNGPGNGGDEATSLAIDNSGNVYVTGGSDGSETGKDYATIKYNSAGVEQWVARYNGPENGDDGATSLTVDELGSVYVTGRSGGSVFASGADYTTLKYNSSGVEQWVIRYNGLGNGWDRANSLAVDGSGNVYVTGESQKSGILIYEYATIKYSQTIGITPISNEIPNQFSLSQNYPNPFNPVTKIRFDIQKQGMVLLKVFDILGKEVQTLVNGSIQPGTYEVDFDATVLTNGVYFYRIEADEFSQTRKMLLIK